jgi:urate oxidase
MSDAKGPMIELAADRYGKAAIRLVRVGRESTPHALRDLTIAIALEGDFTAAHTDGDNTNVIATDTMKNTAYAFAAEHLRGSIEHYATALARHFLDSEQVDRAIVNVREHAWHPIDVGGAPARDAFVRAGEGTRLATVAATRGEVTVEAGVEDLVVMKTTRSAFEGFPRDRFTTLPDADDRLMATKVTAIWRYGAHDIDHDATWAAVRATLLEVFADHDSPSVQSSIWIMAKAMLERHEELDEVRMVLPNLHHWTVDLSPFGMTNDKQVYVATTEPHGLIEATVRRGTT